MYSLSQLWGFRGGGKRRNLLSVGYQVFYSHCIITQSINSYIYRTYIGLLSWKTETYRERLPDQQPVPKWTTAIRTCHDVPSSVVMTDSCQPRLFQNEYKQKKSQCSLFDGYWCFYELRTGRNCFGWVSSFCTAPTWCGFVAPPARFVCLILRVFCTLSYSKT